MKIVPPLMAVVLSSCASSTIYYPQDIASDVRGNSHPVARKAIQLYGDSNGPTHIRVTRNSVEYSAEGGNNNSVTTGIIANNAASVAKWGIGWGFSYGILNSLFGHAGAAYNANQAASAVKASSAAKASAAKAAGASKLPTVGSTIPAQTQATVTVPQAAAPIPAAGSTIQSTIPAVVTPAP